MGENQIINNQIYAHYYIPNYRTNLISERLNPQTYKIRHFCLVGAEDGGFIGFIRKKALRTTEKSGLGAKMRCFPYRKQNYSIAEIVSTMESFLKLTSLFNTMRGRKVKWCIFEPHFVLFSEPFLMFV